MKNNEPKILVLSSVSPKIGPAIIGEQIYMALKQKGLDVDFMTKYPEPNHPEYLWVVNKNYDKNPWVRIKRKILWRFAGVWKRLPGYFFFILGRSILLCHHIMLLMPSRSAMT